MKFFLLKNKPLCSVGNYVLSEDLDNLNRKDMHNLKHKTLNTEHRTLYSELSKHGVSHL
jgi:hypothetical protein